MKQVRLIALAVMAFGLITGLSSSGALAQVSFTEPRTGGCFSNPTTHNTDCAVATFSLMTGGTSGQAGNVITGTSANNVTGLQIVIQNTTSSSLTTYTNPDLLTGFFWGISGNPTFATTGSGSSKSVNGSAIATNSLGGLAIVNPSQCSSKTACTATSLNVGKYWASSYKVGGWSGTSGTFAGAYAASVSGYSGIALGQGYAIGASDPTLVGGGSSLDFGIAGGAGSMPSISGKHPVVQDTVSLQLAFASSLPSFNLAQDVLGNDVYFAYGTNPDTSTVATRVNPSMPEPDSFALFGVAVLGLGWMRLRTYCKNARAIGVGRA